jgi:UDP-3-O-[3-hydroxymyristoyl] N-acetylglucosamine deacetylase
MPRTTLASEISVEGTALHAGGNVCMTLSPAASGSGIIFSRADRVGETRLGTVIVEGDASVGVIEHLMAAIAGMGIDDVIVAVDGQELPILDGDALSYFVLLEKAGTKEQLGQRSIIRVKQTVEFFSKDAQVRLSPSEAPQYSYDLDYSNTKAIGKQYFETTLTRENFARDIAPARTFGFMHELEMLNKMGLGRGASLENTLAIDGDTVVNGQLMRFPDEFVRHKILDAIGDMALAGALLLARFEGVKSGHAANNAILRALFADPANYEII